MNKSIKAVFLIGAVFLWMSGEAQDIVNSPNVTERPSAKAKQWVQGPVLDGEVRNDTTWQALEPIGDLLQNKPNSGLPATEKTEIRVGYTASVFYVSVVCYDREPSKLVVSDARRDAALDNNDSFLFVLDTYHDSQNGFVFGTNPMGIEYDAQVDNEGQGNFSKNGMVGGYNINWDASWDVKTQVGDYGWSAEFAIPLRTLRYASGKELVWGINFQRNIRKTNEVAFWAPLPIQFDLKRLSIAGTLTGLNLKSQGNLKFIPYALGRVARDYVQVPSETKFQPAVGADIKYSITPALTLDLTYNTDFAQVEVDQQQVNLDRFNLFFPEKRTFFLENAGVFNIGTPGELDLFFSRRIGLGPNGERVPIIGGARLSGKVNHTSLGVLNMFTDEVYDTANFIRKNNFTVARVNHQLAQRSTIGAMFINREGMDTLSPNYNRTFAVDGRWGLGKKAQISGYYARTSTPYVQTDEQAFNITSNYQWNGLWLTAGFTQVGEGFNPEVGFLQRSAYRKYEGMVFKYIRMNRKLGLMEIRPHVSYRGYWDFSDFQQTGFLHVDNHWVWVNGWELHSGINFTTEGVVKPFEISKNIFVPTGTYRHKEAQLVFNTNASKPVYFLSRAILGGSFGGKRYLTNATLGIRLGDKFNSEFSLNWNHVELPGGNFNANLYGSRISYSFTPRFNLQSFIQYNSTDDLWSFNVRFSLLEQANTGLFIVYNDIYEYGLQKNRSLTLKYSHVLDLLKKRSKH